jgi:aspartate aminotransferase
MSVSQKIKTSMASSSWIRRMFEEGAELKARLGQDNVYDFTIGNPDLEPPPQFKEALIAVAKDDTPGVHGYMPNAGLLATREALAGYLRRQYGEAFAAKDLVLTCGAAGGLNVVLKAVLDPGDEVVIFAPFFPEYFFYADNHGGVAKVVETDENFDLDLNRLEAGLSPRTRAVIINSPNNPTGRVYGQDNLSALGELLSSHAARHARRIFLVADEPYGRLLYDEHILPSIFAAYPDTVLVTSFSKELSIPGERLGFAAVSPQVPDRDELIAGFILTNRILGFVNAPALMQRAVARVAGLTVDITPYARRRQLFSQVLSQAGLEFIKPQGAFYFFPKAPGGDDLAFVQRLKEENILAVPGRGFGRAGYFRLAFCVPERVIEQAAPGFTRAVRRQ